MANCFAKSVSRMHNDGSPLGRGKEKAVDKNGAKSGKVERRKTGA